MEYTRVIDGFNIYTQESTINNREEDKPLKDLTITYLSNGEYFTESTYRGLTTEKIEKVREKLFDNTLYNLNVEFQCQAIALPTLLFQVEDIIYHK